MMKNIGALVLAAGFSSRFGSHKLRATLTNGQTVIQQTLSHIHYAGLPSIVVTREELLDQLNLTNTKVVAFPDAANGMGASLAFGISKIPDWDGCLVCLADMPFIESSTYRQIADRIQRSSIVLPCYQKKLGNPVGFGADFFPELASLQGDAGGRAVTETHPNAVVDLEVDDMAILNDIDTPDDLTRLQRQ